MKTGFHQFRERGHYLAMIDGASDDDDRPDAPPVTIHQPVIVAADGAIAHPEPARLILSADTQLGRYEVQELIGVLSRWLETGELLTVEEIVLAKTP
ncbi:hypothetical protein [Armatimonas rosea]|uniref:Uncharacterized protein n=1 Tax=Armatimonas rosea TaxID=685828 RepID=A0A7W9SWH2_ARMRO|nr:hypothetical protein [Armatimonas rosea]MBB6054125.1 hypothetical protein [Armatimonas rosea]